VLVIIAVSLVPANTYRFLNESMRLRFQAAHYLVTAATATILTSTLAVAFVTALDLGVEGVFLAGVVGNLIACAYAFWVVRDAVVGRFSRKDLRTMLAFGLPLVPAALVAWLLALVDRVLLAKLGDLDEVGKFAIASRLTLLLLLAVNGFMLAVGPFLYSLYSQDQPLEKAARGRMLTYFAFILSLGALLVTVFAHPILSVLAPAFADSEWAVGPLAFGAVAYGLATLLTVGFSLARRTLHLATLSLVAAATNVALNISLIPPFGFIGAAFATASGYVVLAFAYYVAGQRIYPTPYEPRRVLIIYASAVAFAAVGLIPAGSDAAALALKLGVIVAFVVVLVVTRTMTRGEWTELGRFVVGMAAPGRVARA
jgi:O-antigen/teichoic acid export membrane protein